MGDLSGLLGASAANRTPTHNKRNNSVDLDMTDFLTLMVTQLQNQSIDSSADTSDMLNQLVQMQMITSLTNMTDASVMSYASSLVGKEVTVVTYDGSKAQENVVKIMGTGTYGGEQVVFSEDGNMYHLSEIMAVGRLPEKTQEPEESGNAVNKPASPVESPKDTNPAKPTKDTDPVEEPKDADPAEEVPADKPVEGAEESEEAEPKTDTEDETQPVDPTPAA